MPSPDKKRRFWQVDSSIFKSGRTDSFLQRRIIPPFRTVGKSFLLLLAFSYPITLVYIGVAFGGIAFWLFLLGSFAMIGLVISRLGYSRNFASWGNFGFKQLGALFAALLIAAGFYVGIIYLKILFVPIMFAALGFALIVVLFYSKK